MASVLVKKGAAKINRIKSHLGFDNPATLVGTSKWTGSDGKPISVYYDPASAGGKALATDILQNRIDDLMAFCDDAMGVRGGSGNVLIIPGNNGAYHYDCSFVQGGDWYEDDMGLTGPTPNNNGGLVTGLVMAEVIESYMGLQGAGWNCGGSGGEGLSRIFAETSCGGINGAMIDFSARSSYDGSNWIDKDQGTDQDYPSIGCAMLYLDWMRGLGYPLQQIAKTGGSTLAQNYQRLTGKSTAWADFSAAVKGVDINAANPFNIADTPYPLNNNPPPPPPPVLSVNLSSVSGQMGQTTSFSPSISGGTPPYSQSWVYGDGFAGTSPSHVYATAGSFSVSLGVADAAGNTVGVSATATISGGVGPTGNVLTLTTALQAGQYAVGSGGTPAGPTPPANIADFVAWLQAVGGLSADHASVATGWSLVIQGVLELFSNNSSQGWADLFTGILQVLGFAHQTPHLSPVILQIVDAIIQIVGTQLGLPQLWITALEAVVAQLFPAQAAAFKAKHAGLRRF